MSPVGRLPGHIRTSILSHVGLRAGVACRLGHSLPHHQLGRYRPGARAEISLILGDPPGPRPALWRIGSTTDKELGVISVPDAISMRSSFILSTAHFKPLRSSLSRIKFSSGNLPIVYEPARLFGLVGKERAYNRRFPAVHRHAAIRPAAHHGVPVFGSARWWPLDRYPSQPDVSMLWR